MTDDVFRLEEYGNFLFISANGKRVTGKFDSSHRIDLDWIICMLNGSVNVIAYWEKENEELKSKLFDCNLELEHNKESVDDAYWKLTEIKKENEQLKKEKESWKSNAYNQYSFNSILLNELSIAQKQGYEVSDPFKKLMGEKE